MKEVIPIGCNCGKKAPKPTTEDAPNPNPGGQTVDAWWQATPAPKPPAVPIPQ